MSGFLRDTIARLLLISSFLLNVGLLLFFYFFIKQTDIPIVLHYNVDWGVDYFGEFKNIFTLPFVGLVIFLLNFLLALKVRSNAKGLSYFLLSVSLISAIFLWLAGIALYIINS